MMPVPQEVAYALEVNKPVVLIVMDQEAWEMLTVPGGAAAAWSCSKYGPPLSQHENYSFPGVDGFSEDTLTKLFNKLASINLCPCRPLDETNWGQGAVLANMTDYILKDISYMKEHATIQSLATTWDSRGSKGSLLLHGPEAQSWSQWIGFAESAGLKPPPTPLQKTFVQASSKAAKLRRRQAWGIAAALVAVILLGAAASVALAVREAAARQDAAVNAREAAMWTILGKVATPSASIYDMRAVMHVLKSSEPSKRRLGAARAEAARTFYAILRSPALHVGQLEGLQMSWGFSWSPGSDKFAVSSQLREEGNPVMVQGLGSPGPTALVSGSAGPQSPFFGLSWGPDGTLVGNDVAYGLTQWRMDGERGDWLPEELAGRSPRQPMVPWRPMVWIPGEGRRLVALDSNSSDSTTLRLWHFHGANNVTSEAFASGAAPISDVAVSADGLLLGAARIGAKSVEIWDLSGAAGSPKFLQKIVVAEARGDSSKLDISFHPDGRTLVCSIQSDVKMYNVAAPGSLVRAGGCTESCGAYDAIEGDWSSRPWDLGILNDEPLTRNQQAQLQALGWNATSWKDCSQCRKNHWGPSATSCTQALYVQEQRCPMQQLALWDDLTGTEQLAARTLGYTAASWDTTSPYSCCASQPLEAPLKPLGLGDIGPKVGAGLAGAWLEDFNEGNAAALQQQQQPPDPVFGLLFTPDSAEESLWLQSAHHSPDGTRLAVGAGDSAEIWDLTGDKLKWKSKRLSLPTANIINTAEWSPDSRYLGYASSDGTASIWDFELDRNHSSYTLSRQHSGMCVAVDFQPLDSNTLVSLGKSDQKLHVHNLMLKTTKQLDLPAEDHYCYKSAFSSTGRLAIACGHRGEDKGKLLLWDSASEGFDSLSSPELGGSPFIQSVAWSPDGNLLAAAVGGVTSPLRKVALWDLFAIPPKPYLLDIDGASEYLSFSPDGKMLATCILDTTMRSPHFLVWDVASRKRIELDLPLQPFGVRPLAVEWSPVHAGGEYTLSVSGVDDTLYIVHGKLHQAGSAVSVQHVRAHVGGISRGKINKGACEIHGPSLLAAVFACFVWDSMLDVSDEAAAFFVHCAVAWRPDGQVLATVGSADQKLRLWDASDPRQITPFQIMDNLGMELLDLAWAPPYYNAIALAGDTGEVRVVPIMHVDDMAGIIDGIIMPFTRKNFTEADAIFLGVPPGVVSTTQQ